MKIEMDDMDQTPRSQTTAVTAMARTYRANASSALWALVFALAVLATQFGSLEREVIDMDEATFILMAADVLDGNLPYVELYANKPPMGFFLLAGALWAFGESLLVVRLFGAFCLWTSCIAVFSIAVHHIARTPAALAVSLLVAVQSVSYGQYMSMELPATAALMGALWFLVVPRRSSLSFAAAGLLMSLAPLTRSNLLVVPIAFGLWFTVATLRPSFDIRWRAVSAFVIAGLAPPAALVFIYWQADALLPLLLATVSVPASHLSFGGTVWHSLVNGWGFLLDNWRAPLPFMPFTLLLLAGLARSANVWRQSCDAPQTRTYHEMLWLLLGSTALSVAMTGILRHYWLQVFPISAIFCAYGVGWMLQKRGLCWIGGLLPLLALGAAGLQTWPSAIKIIASPEYLSKRHTIRKAADAIAADIRPDDTLWAFKHHLIYWYLERRTMSRILQPNTITNKVVMVPLTAAGYVAQDELGRILALRPTYLVTKLHRDGDPVPEYARSDDYGVRDLLDDHYSLFYNDKSLSPPGLPTLVYKLREESDAGAAGDARDLGRRNDQIS